MNPHSSRIKSIAFCGWSAKKCASNSKPPMNGEMKPAASGAGAPNEPQRLRRFADMLWILEVLSGRPALIAHELPS